MKRVYLRFVLILTAAGSFASNTFNKPQIRNWHRNFLLSFSFSAVYCYEAVGKLYQTTAIEWQDYWRDGKNLERIVHVLTDVTSWDMREGNEKYHQTLIRDGLCSRPRLEHGTARIQVQRVAATPTRPFQFLNRFVTETNYMRDMMKANIWPATSSCQKGRLIRLVTAWVETLRKHII